MQVSDGIKYPSSPKKLLIDSFTDLLPGEVVNRPKMGFVLPWELWLKGPLRPLAEDAIQIISEHEAFNHEAVNELWERFVKGDAEITWSRVWPLITLAIWMKENDVR
jgi:asparagine synthase (glutamine-hydrolysing)